jgi:hypothetical protein
VGREARQGAEREGGERGGRRGGDVGGKREEDGETEKDRGRRRGGKQGALSHSWQATKNRERRRTKRSRKFRAARSRDEFIEYLGSAWWGWKKQSKGREERESRYRSQQPIGVQVMMTLTVIAAVRGGERDEPPLGFMKRRDDGRGGQSEEQGEGGVRPVGLPNIMMMMSFICSCRNKK